MQKTQNKSQYEQSRDERIKANLERMQKLGIADISLDLKSQFQAKRSSRTFSNRKPSPAGPTSIRSAGPARRSSKFRLQNSPVSYSETQLGNKDESMEKGIVLEVGAKPEIYTEEHEKLLGHTEKSWTLSVDGYGKDGKRIYDPVVGKSCHQCRQKTLGYHTNCSQCSKVQGQFCGDCLYMRYGEHVLEAIQNPEWICPACRGICNCSFCRTAKGWPPTGTLYRKISQLGFKSVAHYLIQTRRAHTNTFKNPETPDQDSAKKPPPVPDTDEENLKVEQNDLIPLFPLGEQTGDNEFNSKENEEQNIADLDMTNQTSIKRSLSFPGVGDHLGLPKLEPERSTEDLKDEEEIEMYFEQHKEKLTMLVDSLLVEREKIPDDEPDVIKMLSGKEVGVEDIEPSANSIGGRLRQRRQKGHENDDDSAEAIKKIPDYFSVKKKIPDGKRDANKISSDEQAEIEKCVLFTDEKHCADSSITLEGSSKQKKRVLDAEPSADSVAGRLRQRRS